jgi:hypothetical protein
VIEALKELGADPIGQSVLFALSGQKLEDARASLKALETLGVITEYWPALVVDYGLSTEPT